MKKLLILLLLLPINVFSLNIGETLSPKIYLYDLTNDQVVYEKSSNERAEVASLTKILTVMTVLDSVKDINSKVTITYEMMASVEPGAAVAGFKVGDEVTYLDMIYGAMLPSGADATNSLAILVAGSKTEFARMMNEEAKKIGAYNSNFVNPSGMDADNHYSTASDIALILKYALQNETFKMVYNTKKYTMSNGVQIHGPINRFNKHITNSKAKITGVKTGYTKRAGYSAASVINNDGHEYILVTIEGKIVEDRVGPNQIDAGLIADTLADTYNNYKVVKKGSTIKNIPVKNGSIMKLPIKISNDVFLYKEGEYDTSRLFIDYSGISEIDEEVSINDTIGNIKVYYDNNLLYEEEVVLKEKINYLKKDKNKSLFNYLLLLAKIFIIIVCLLVIRKYIKRYFRYHKKKKINDQELAYIEDHLLNNNGLMHANIKGHKVPFKIVKLDREKMIVTLKRLK